MATGGTNTDALSEETFDFLCNVCKRKGKTTEAKIYCTDCQDYYCLTCVKVHDDVPLLTGHKIVDKGMIQRGSAKKLPLVPTERCDKHGLKPVDMYCQNHDQVGCSTCMAVDHRLCKGIFYIPDYLQNMASDCNPKKIQKKLAFTEENLKVTGQHCEQEKQHLLKRKAESIQSVRHVRKELDQRLDELEQASVVEIENKYEEMISQIEEDINASRDAKRNVVTAQDKLAAAGNNISQIFVSTKIGQSVAFQAEGILHKKKLSCHYEYVSFSSDTELKEILGKLESLGQVTSKFLFKGMHEYSLEDQSESRFPMSLFSFIVSACLLEDGTMILANHRNMRRLDKSTYRVRDRYRLPGYPCQVCAINNQEVAVSYKDKEIMLISLGKQMTQKSLIKTDFDCYALAYTNDNLYISGQYTSVYIYSVSGQKLKQLRLPEPIQSWISGLLSKSNEIRIDGLTVSEDGSKIYVANSKKGLIVLDNNGKVVREFNDSSLAVSSDVHLTRYGTVLVRGCSSNILQFGPDGVLIGEVLTNVPGLHAFCCNQQLTKMIVSPCFENKIQVYDLVL